MKLAYLYVITNLVNDKQYYGWGTNPKRRWSTHIRGGGSRLLYKAFNEYGLDNFRFEVLCQGDIPFIQEMEQIMIAEECSKAPYGYNLTDGGEGEIGLLNGPLNPRAVPITVNGVEYGCIGDAAESLGCNRKTLERHYRRYGPVFDWAPYNSERRSKAHTLKKHSQETKDLIGKKARERDNKLSKHHSARKVLVNGKEYGCIKEASIAESINYSTLKYRFQSFSKTGKWPEGYAYLDS